MSLEQILASQWGTQAREFMALGLPAVDVVALFGMHIDAESAMMAVGGLPGAIAEQTTYIAAANEVQYVPEKLVEPVVALQASIGVGKMPVMDMNLWELLDMILPEELLGLDITPDQLGGTDPGFLGLGAKKTGRVLYDNVWIENGKVKCIRKGQPRTLGYTPGFAKKKFRTRRRRKRLTKRDMYILEVIKTNPQAGALALML